MSEAQERTAGPIQVSGPDEYGDYTISPSNELLAIATVVQNGLRPQEETTANAVYLAKCWNGYPKAIAALREARGMLRSCGFDGIDDEPDPELVASWNKSLAKIDSVLSDLGEDENAAK